MPENFTFTSPIEQDRRFMAEALDLAALGRGRVEPNPMVGAVIVREGRRIAAGHHERFGGPHAEVQALRAAAAGGIATAGATMYVTLEPCCHHGKTPPCTEAIIAAGLGRVVVAMSDPDPRVAGRGIEALRSAGLTVDVGIGQPKAHRLLAAYRKLRTAGRPWVICKWAQTADGALALPPAAGRWISSRASRQYVHRLRGLVDGVLVGIGTVLADDPLLTNRSGAGNQPARVVLDSKLTIPAGCQLLNTPAISPVIVATTAATAAGLAVAGERGERGGCDGRGGQGGRDGRGERGGCDGQGGRGGCDERGKRSERAGQLRGLGVEVLELPAGRDGRVDLPALLAELGSRQWTHLLVEGGRAVLEAFVESGLADELLVFVSPDRAAASVPTGIPAGTQSGVTDGGDLPRFDIADLRRRLSSRCHEEIRESKIGDDRLLRWRLSD